LSADYEEPLEHSKGWFVKNALKNQLGKDYKNHKIRYDPDSWKKIQDSTQVYKLIENQAGYRFKRLLERSGNGKESNELYTRYYSFNGANIKQVKMKSYIGGKYDRSARSIKIVIDNKKSYKHKEDKLINFKVKIKNYSNGYRSPATYYRKTFKLSHSLRALGLFLLERFRKRKAAAIVIQRAWLRYMYRPGGAVFNTCSTRFEKLKTLQ